MPKKFEPFARLYTGKVPITIYGAASLVQGDTLVVTEDVAAKTGLHDEETFDRDFPDHFKKVAVPKKFLKELEVLESEGEAVEMKIDATKETVKKAVVEEKAAEKKAAKEK